MCIRDSLRAVHDEVGPLPQLGDLVAAAAHQQAGHAVGAEPVDGGEGGQVAEVVAGVEDGAGAPLADVLREGDALVHAGRAEFEDQATGFDDQAVSGGELGEGAAQGLEGGLRIGGAARVHGDRPPLLLDPRTLAHPGGVEHSRQLGPHGGDPGMRGGSAHGAGAGVPALGTVVPQHHELLEPGHPGEPAVPHRHLGRPPGDHGDPGHLRRQPHQRGHRLRMRPRLLRIRHDRRERPVEVQRDHRPPGPRQHLPEPVPPDRRDRRRQRIGDLRLHGIRVTAHESTLSTMRRPTRPWPNRGGRGRRPTARPAAPPVPVSVCSP